MNYKIPKNVLVWNTITDETFLTLYNSNKTVLFNSFLFYNDVPFELAGCRDHRNFVEYLTQVFQENDRLGIKIPNNEMACSYSIQGIQKQYNEVVRMQYYYPNEMLGDTIGCYAYYVKCIDTESGIRKELKSLPLLIDKSYVDKDRQIQNLINKYKDAENGIGAVLWLTDAIYNTPKSRSAIFGYISQQLTIKYFHIISQNNP